MNVRVRFCILWLLSSMYLLLLDVRDEVSRCRAEAADAMLSVWRAERGVKGSKLHTRLR